MRVLIIEDEQPAARLLQRVLAAVEPEAEVLALLHSVEESVHWLQQNPAPDLILLDIQLGDGLSFDIFKQITVQSPVIFTTAYDAYTLRAFKLNSVDYLLKPIEPEELRAALLKFKQFFPASKAPDWQQLLVHFQKPAYRERLLIRSGTATLFIPISQAAYFYSEDGLSFVVPSSGKRSLLETTLEKLEQELDPGQFFRINRKLIVQISAIQRIEPYFNSRLSLQLTPDPTFEVIVSRERVADFKEWLDR